MFKDVYHLRTLHFKELWRKSVSDVENTLSTVLTNLVGVGNSRLLCNACFEVIQAKGSQNKKVKYAPCQEHL